MNSRVALVAAAALAAVSLSACSSSAGPSADSAHAASATASGSPGAAASAGPSPQWKTLGKPALTGALLSLSDMPSGWSVDSSGSSGSHTFCNYHQPNQPKVQVSRSFTKGSGFAETLASAGIRQFDSPEAAAQSFAALQDALQTCTGETYQGEKLTYTAMSVDALGDKALGVKISTGAGAVLQEFILAGPALINVGSGGLSADADVTAALAKKQVADYEAAAH